MFQLSNPVSVVNDLASVAPGFSAPIQNPSLYKGDPEVDRLRSRHETYSLYSDEWDFYLAAYEGGKEIANGRNLWKHQRENELDFNNRCLRVHYLNYCDQIVDYFTNFIFTETIQRDGGTNEALYQEFIADVNRKGDTIETVMRDISTDREIFGHMYILVDLPRVQISSEDALTKQDEENLNIRPYWVLIRPEEITDWVVDDFESFLYVKRRQEIFRPAVLGGELRRYEKYTEFFVDRVKISFVDITKPEEPQVAFTEIVDNPWKFIPIEVSRYKRSKRYPFIGNSFLRDFAYNNREVMNYTSLIQEFLYRQCFNLLVKEDDSNGIPMRDGLDGEWGEANVLSFPKGATAPAYLSPPAQPAEFLQSERAKIAAEMFKRAAQETMNELANGEKSSGFSQSQSFSKTVPYISSRADSLERTEMRLMAMTMKMIGKKWDGKIKYKDRYELTNITDAITQLTSVFRDLMMPSETFVKEELKRLVAELDGKIPPDKMQKIVSEIEELDFKKWQETQLQALVGKGSSPADQNKPKQSGTMVEVSREARANVGSTKKARPKKNAA